jgi:hypothetical protein
MPVLILHDEARTGWVDQPLDAPMRWELRARINPLSFLDGLGVLLDEALLVV